jgi:4-hydroxybenzoate polyprenyltransferase
LKNIVCASLIALSPATSGSAALSLSSSNNSWSLLFGVPALWRLVGMIFCGFVGREILMDINDVDDDSAHDVRTVPVEFGRKFAARTALSCTAAMTVAATVGPMWQIQRAVGGSLTWTFLLSTLRTSPATRKLLLASIGSLAMMRRAWHVYKTDGEDRDIVDRAVEEGKLSVMFLLASFV